MTVIALLALFLTTASLVAMGGVLFTPFLLGAFLLALAGVLARHGDRTVSRRDDEPRPTQWREG